MKKIVIFLSILFAALTFSNLKPIYAFDLGSVETLAGNGEQGNKNSKREQATFSLPSYTVVSKNGQVYISDTQNHLIRTIKENGTVATIAGYSNRIDEYGNPVGGDRTGYIAMFNYPKGLAFDNNGNLYVVDSGNGKIKMIKPSGYVETVATGLNSPTDIVIDQKGTLYVTDTLNHRIVRITQNGTVDLIAGGNYHEKEDWLVGGLIDGIGADAQFNEPKGLALDDTTLYVADSANHRIRKVNLKTNRVTTIAGSGEALIEGTSYLEGGYQDGHAENARFNFPEGIDYANNTVYIADSYNHTIRALRNGVVETITGQGKPGFENGYESQALFSGPTDVVHFNEDTLLIVDQWNNMIRKLNTYNLPANHSNSMQYVYENLAIEMNNHFFPLSKIANTLGLSIHPKHDGQVRLSNKKDTLTLHIGEYNISNNGSMIIDLPENTERMFMSFILEAFKLHTTWHEQEKIVLIR